MWQVLVLSIAVFGAATLYPSRSAGQVSQGAVQSTEHLSLNVLVRLYVQESSRESSKDQLSQIMKHPEASLETVSTAIRALPHHTTAPVGAQPHRSIMVRGKQASYALYVPVAYDPAQAYPLIVCLHGAGFTGESYLERWVPRLQNRYILACPTISMGAWWTRFGEDLTLATMRAVRAEYHIDPNRVFLTGMSNGGIGAWIIGMHYPDRFAGIAPMASGIDDVLFPFVENLQNTPVYIIHGAEDRIMPVQLSRDLVKQLDRYGIVHTYREHAWTHPHAGGHFFPRQELPALIEWFDKQRRTSLPHEVSLVRDATHLLPMHWVRIDTTDRIAAFTENLIDSRNDLIVGRVYATLYAELVSPNHIAVKTNHVRRYTLFFNQDLVDFSRPIVVETNGKQSFNGLLQPTIETLLHEARHRSDHEILYSSKVSINVLPSSRIER